MTPKQIAEMKKLAQNATPGPWVTWRPFLSLGHMGVAGVIPVDNLHPEAPYQVKTEHNRGCSYAKEIAVPSGATRAPDGSDAAKNMEHIASSNPQAVLELIEHIDHEKSRADDAERERDAIRAEVERLRDAICDLTFYSSCCACEINQKHQQEILHGKGL